MAQKTVAFHLFAPKTLGSIGIGSGVLGGGGVIYWYQIPTTWKALLVKEGYVFLSNEYDYKGMFEDQKTTSEWTSETSVSDATDSNVKDKVQGYCKKLEDKLPSPSDANYESDKKKLIAFCTSEGIQTVKGRLIQSQKQGWLENSNDDEYKIIFAVYRYNTDFINWLKEVDKDGNKEDLSEKSGVNTGHTKLKDACDKLLKMKHKEVDNYRYFDYVSWWCVNPGYKTIKEKIQKSVANWTEKDQGDSDWNELVTKWKHTEVVKKWANKAKSQAESTDLSEDSLKALCNSTNVASQLSDNESYQEKYTVIKSVCAKNSSS